MKEASLAYYSRKDIQKAIYDFCQNRETVPRSGDIFGKRPNMLHYESDVIELAKEGASSFHCSEELWKNPLDISTELNQEQINELRIGWDLLIDIDCKWLEYSKKAAIAIVKALEAHGVNNIGIKFSGGKGFHIIVPWKAFPKRIRDSDTKDLFPEIPRKILAYLKFYSERIMKESLPDDFYSQFKNINIKKGIKCRECSEIASEYFLVEFQCSICRQKQLKRFEAESQIKNYKCPDCRKDFIINFKKPVYECKKCKENSDSSPTRFSSSIEVDLFELMGLDVILVSPRHLFRAPYSLHEKGLVSMVIDKSELENFDPKMASSLRVKIKNFYPEAKEDEARELLIQALDWHKEVKKETKKSDFKEVKIDKRNITPPPCIEKIEKGLEDGKKRGLFILLNFYRSLGLEIEEIEKKLEDWNKKNKPPLRQGYIQAQINWSQRQKPLMPPNCDKDYYKGIGVCSPDELCKLIKNPINYTIKKQFRKR